MSSITEPNQQVDENEDTQDIYGLGEDIDEVEELQEESQEVVEEPVEEPEEEPEEESTEEVEEETTPSSFGLSEEAAKTIGAEIAKSIAPKQPQQAEEPPKKLTPEERDKLLKRVNVSSDLLQSLGFDEPTPEQIEAFQNFADNIAQHGYAMAAAQTQLVQRQFSEQITPVQQAVENYQRQQMEKDFFGKFPALQKFPTALRAAAERVEATDKSGNEKTLDQVYEEVAANAVNIIQEFNPEFDISKATPSAPSSQEKVPEMSTGMKGGRSQGGAGGKTSPNNPDADIYS